MRLKHLVISAAAGLLLAAPAWADHPGAGMMGGGMMGGGYGMGGMGGMHHGMMGHDGMGYGMMGPGMMGAWGGEDLNLSADQRAKIATIQRDFRHWQWETMEKMHELDWRSDEARRGGTFDEQAERRAYDQMATLRKQMFENSLEARKRFDAVLTSQQREQMQRRWRR